MPFDDPLSEITGSASTSLPRKPKPTPRPSTYDPDTALNLISKYESGDQNVPNYRFDPTHTAQGHFQITNTNWRNYGPRAGVDLGQYPSAMAAPRETQAKVAKLMYGERGFQDWAPYNPALRRVIGGSGQLQHSQDPLSRITQQRTAAPKPQALADPLSEITGTPSGQTPPPITRVNQPLSATTAPPAQPRQPSVPIEQALANVTAQTNRIMRRRGIATQPQPVSQSAGPEVIDAGNAEPDERMIRERIRQQVRKETPAPLRTPFDENRSPDLTAENEEVERRYQAMKRAETPEMTDIRKEYGQMSAPTRAVAQPLVRGGAQILKLVGGVTSLAGIAPNQLSNWANARAQIAEEGSQLAPLTAEGEEIKRGIPEKVAQGVADLGIGIGEIVLLKKATNLPFNQLMALESALKTSNQPVGERAKSVTEAYALGTVLDQHLSRAASAALFGGPTAIQSAGQVARGQMSPEDALIQTGIQAGAGALLGGRKPSSLERGLERLPPAEQVEPDAAIAARLRGEPSPSATETQPSLEVTAQPETPTAPAMETGGGAEVRGLESEVPPHHSNFQPRYKRGERAGDFKKGKPQYPVEEPAQAEADVRAVGVEPSASAPAAPEMAKPEPVPEVAPPETSPTTQPEGGARAAEPEVAPRNPTPTQAPEGATVPPSTTSARKAQMAQDRAELDLPELAAPERKSWQQSLDAAKPEDANRLADEVLEKPRPLNDTETASIVTRAQQVKNELADVRQRLGEAKGDDIPPLANQAKSLQAEFDKLTSATKKSGTEKGRTLAAQKLTINQDFDLTSLNQRLKEAKGRELTDDELARNAKTAKQIEDLQQQLAVAHERLAQRDLQRQIDRVSRRQKRAETRGSLDDEFAQLRAQFAQARAETRGVQPSGLAGLDPEGKLTKLIGQMARNRVKAGVTDAAQLVDDIHAAISEHIEGLTKRDVRDAISGYGLEPQGDRRGETAKQLASIRGELKRLSAQEDIAAGRRLSARDRARQTQLRKQADELQRRLEQKDYAPSAKRIPPTYSQETRAQEEQVARLKLDFERQVRRAEEAGRGKPEKAADLLVRWGRAAKLGYISTLGKLSSAAGGRMVMSPLENLVGEVVHRVSPELSRRATTEGGGFDRAAEVAALWKSGRFKQMLNQLTKGSSDLDVLYGPRAKMLDKEMSGEGALGVPGRAHGALKEYPRQAEFDRAFIKVLRSYERAGKDIGDPNVQLAGRMEAYNSAERARFQQRNFISDTFNNTMRDWERRGGIAKGLAKAGKFIFPITRVPVNVVGETLNYTFGLPRAVVETAVRGGVKNLTTEQANNVMRAYKKGGVGLAIMTYAFLNPQQFGGYYQKGDKRKESEPQPGEVMFFGVRIPKWATHIPIIEAGQLAATVRRVWDAQKEKDATPAEAAASGISAGAKGVASGVPFYETPARFFTGQEGPRGAAQALGEQARGMIPGFVQEAAQRLDRDAQGKPIRRTPQGSFGERFSQTIKLGVPGLRQQVPINHRGEKSQRNATLTDQFRSGKITSDDLQSLVDNETITEADKAKIEKLGALTDFQSRFANIQYPSTALDKYERMNAAQRAEVEDLMTKRAKSLINSKSLTQTERDKFRERLEKVGINPE